MHSVVREIREQYIPTFLISANQMSSIELSKFYLLRKVRQLDAICTKLHFGEVKAKT